MVAAFATLILISNLMGMVPGLEAPTANFNVTLALGLTSFLYYNMVAVRQNGVGDISSNFAGPMPAMRC